ncbi:hypothetical protein Val02_41630 [Virgisporangium aliadipatigenens]|uniref:Beta propeller domain-containing protein n=1 Tax=Virgisporangium aliadipatigenens TaxID=741659 RepID=A0A8J4DSI6_9ACTN|nr:beta-propeller domain-containing protein [Virgisporangium aliadipatigenens]GIJ47277.1 hypothetical protein Val02_41630 [Virgisporangium aliadipatigenens]
MTRSRHLRTAAAVTLIAGLATGCTDAPDTNGHRPGGGEAAAGSVRLVSFTSCEDALAGLRAAARDSLEAWGYAAEPPTVDGRRGAADTGGGAVAAPNAAGAQAESAAKTGEQGGYSGTNTHEAGVDEPDLVKTDGKRIITVVDGILRVYDAARRVETAKVALGQTQALRYPGGGGDLLLSGDHVLLINRNTYYGREEAPPAARSPQLTLVDIGAQPRVLGTFAMDGQVVDARQVGAQVRVVMRSTPDIERPQHRANPDEYAAAMLRTINQSPIEDWLPEYTVTGEGGSTGTGRVGCSSVAHPAGYSASKLLTVLTFDLGKPALGEGDPVTVAADGDTVYSNGQSLYVANDRRWRGGPAMPAARRADPEPQRTEVYKFDTSKPGKPTFAAGGAVDGWLLNQYSMSEWDGRLRIATTGEADSSVYVLRQDGSNLVQEGKVGGLGKGERIYSVRFVGTQGYVVTFKQTDPLYTVDLRDPKQPKVTGELKITGYSAYLHPAGDGRLIGIGQEASETGRTQGTQLSMFDVSDPAAPKRLAQYHVKYGHSEAEFDPHAFLYWPKTGLLVVPLNRYTADDGGSASGALALKVSDAGITEAGFLKHPAPNGNTPQRGALYPIRRAIVIDGTLWTLSQNGLMANDLQTLAQQAWLSFT